MDFPDLMENNCYITSLSFCKYLLKYFYTNILCEIISRIKGSNIQGKVSHAHHLLETKVLWLCVWLV